MKHDAHVRTAFKHFFPFKTFLLILFFFFTLGMHIGNTYGVIVKISSL